MIALVSTVGAYVCGLTLLFSGLAHMRYVSHFQSVLRRQKLIPVGIVATAARGIAVLEFALGAGALLVLAVAQSEAATRPVLAAAAVLFAAYAGYSAHLVSKGQSVPCGCSRTEIPINAAVVARAAGLSLAALLAALGTGRILTPAGESDFAIAAIASIALASILWVLPAALHDPADSLGPALLQPSRSLEGSV